MICLIEVYIFFKNFKFTNLGIGPVTTPGGAQCFLLTMFRNHFLAGLRESYRVQGIEMQGLSHYDVWP